MTQIKDRCPHAEPHNGGLRACMLTEGHTGEHVTRAPGEQPSAPPPRVVHRPARLRTKFPPGVSDAGRPLYLRGAVDYAMGRALDRLAADLEQPVRGKGESDHDLSARLRRVIDTL